MKKISVLLYGLVGLIGIFASSVALADRIGVGFYIGGPYPYGFYRPFYRPYFYPYPYYPPVVVSPPPVVVAPEPAPVYVEQGAPQQQVPQQPAAPQASAGHWYHCDKPEGYYPYIKECPGGWKPVEPTPPPANAAPSGH
ncbi:MAG TPA: hypothetical protein VFN66_06215 [Burkholderiales bacterium]|nr:hypothetical protein [Burkholderiales bacterium]